MTLALALTLTLPPVILEEIARLRKRNGVTEADDEADWHYPDEDVVLGGAGAAATCNIGYGDLDDATRARMQDSTGAPPAL